MNAYAAQVRSDLFTRRGDSPDEARNRVILPTADTRMPVHTRGCYGCHRTAKELDQIGHGRGCYFDQASR